MSQTLSEKDMDTLIHGYDLIKFLVNREFDIAQGNEDFSLLYIPFQILIGRTPSTEGLKK